MDYCLGSRFRLQLTSTSATNVSISFGNTIRVTVANNSVRITESIKDAASEATYGMMTWYHGNETGQIPGAFPEKWWEGAALFLALLNYWHFTGDDQYNDQLSQGLEFQGGPNGDYWTSNYSSFLVRICSIPKRKRAIVSWLILNPIG